MPDVYEIATVERHTDAGPRAWVATVFKNGDPVISRTYSRPIKVTDFDRTTFFVWDAAEWSAQSFDSPISPIDRIDAAHRSR